MPGLGTLKRLPSDKEVVYRDVDAALSRLRTWMHGHNAAEGRADAAGLAETLRVLWQALKAAGAEGSLRSWCSGKGLGGWEGPSEEGQLLETGSYVEGVMNGDHAAENSAEIIEVQEGMVSRSLNFFPYNAPKWIDFRDAVDEYAKELLDALRPAGLAVEDDDQPAPPARIVINHDSNTITIDGESYPGIDPDGLAVVAALLRLKEEGNVRAVSAEKLRKRLANCHHDKTLTRWIGTLPKPIRDCIKGKRGAGRWLELPGKPA